MGLSEQDSRLAGPVSPDVLQLLGSIGQALCMKKANTSLGFKAFGLARQDILMGMLLDYVSWRKRRGAHCWSRGFGRLQGRSWLGHLLRLLMGIVRCWGDGAVTDWLVGNLVLHKARMKSCLFLKL